MAPQRLILAHTPTPLWRNQVLDTLVGAQVWVKRDDMSSGAAAGNKVRKLEFLLADARARSSTHIVTCGGSQSNHARATAVLAAELAIKSVLLLRTDEPETPPELQGNLLLDRLVDANIRWISPAQYAKREVLMAAVAREIDAQGGRAYVIPEGGSNGLGALGYVEAMREVRQQLDGGQAGALEQFDCVVHACGSGGTAAGTALGALQFDVAQRVEAMAVCNDAAYFGNAVERIIAEARDYDPELLGAVELTIHDRYKGPAYAVQSDEQRRFLIEVARRTGLILDPVYSGKALYGLAQLPQKPERVLFIHTGGLPGLLAQSRELAPSLKGNTSQPG